MERGKLGRNLPRHETLPEEKAVHYAPGNVGLEALAHPRLKEVGPENLHLKK